MVRVAVVILRSQSRGEAVLCGQSVRLAGQAGTVA
jgi:hypothetical protein